ncbi:MAG: hypothetical protein WC533_01870 [Candidatus Pacearchaeota archaeon]
MNPIEIGNRIDEFWTLHNRLHRYAKFIVREALTSAKERGIGINVDDKENVDCSRFVNLIRTEYPALCRRYEQGLEKHDRLYSELFREHTNNL